MKSVPNVKRLKAAALCAPLSDTNNAALLSRGDVLRWFVLHGGHDQELNWTAERQS